MICVFIIKNVYKSIPNEKTNLQLRWDSPKM